MTEDELLMRIGNRLKEIRAEFGFTQGEFAERLGINQNTLSQYENGKRKVPDQIKQILGEEFGVNIAWFVAGMGDMLSAAGSSGIPEELLEEVVFVDFLDARASAGYGIENHEVQSVAKVPFPAKLLKPYRQGSARAMEVSGLSMSPTLEPGDTIYFIEDLQNGDGIYVVNWNHELFVKRLDFLPAERKIRVISDNPDYETKTIEAGDEDFHIIGRCVGMMRWL